MRRVFVVLAVVGWVILSTTRVLAHAEPVRVRPGDGAVLTVSPIVVEFVMSQDLSRRPGANDIRVFGVNGEKVTTVGAAIDNENRRKLSVPLPQTLAPGVYAVKWQTLSADDGDAAEGQTTFTFDPSARPSAGKEILRESLLDPTPASPSAQSFLYGDDDGEIPWIATTAIVLLVIVVGGGAAFLLVSGDR